MNRSLLILLLCLTSWLSLAKDNKIFPVGKYSLHFTQNGEVIKPDGHYVNLAVHDVLDGFKKSAIKNFQKAASYGNTYATYYASLLYLQEEDYVNGYAWLSMVETKSFPEADNVLDLLDKLENSLSSDDMSRVNDLKVELKEVYGAEAAYSRRMAWSKNFKMAGTHLKGNIPQGIRIQTDLSHGTINRGTANITPIVIERAIKTFVYEYEFDYRIKEGDVIMGEIELLDDESNSDKK